MKKPKLLKECKTVNDAQNYIVENDGLSDADFDVLEFVEVGPDDDVAEITPVPLDADTAARIRQIAKRTGRTATMLIRDWAAQESRREMASKKPAPPHRESKKRATG